MRRSFNGALLRLGAIVAASLSFSPITAAARTHGEALPFEEVAELYAPDTEKRDYLGVAVALSGHRALLGAGGARRGGAAYVFERRPDGTWAGVMRLEAADGAPGDRFGSAVALRGNLALVSAERADDPVEPGDLNGAAYVFERQAGGRWSQVARLASPAEPGFLFGLDVALDVDRALVGAAGDTVYVFERELDGTWSHGATLTTPEVGDEFGSDVSLSGDRALIGATRGDGVMTDSGAAYVFERQPDGIWVETALLRASDGLTGQRFGSDVAVDDERAVIGAIYGDGIEEGRGAAYVFQRQADGTWSEAAKLVASDGAPSDTFGVVVALSGERALIGSNEDSDPLHEAGSAYVFERQDDGAWAEVAILTASDAAERDLFGSSVALAGRTVLVGAPWDDGRGENSGSAYVFDTVLQLEMSGACPGEVTIAISGATPGERVAALLAPREGTTPIPSGPCAGVEVGLEEPKLLTEIDADERGRVRATVGVPPRVCGSVFQAVDLFTCSPTDVVPVP